MSDILLVMVGGGIGLLGSIIALLYQERDSKRKRKWALQDIAREYNAKVILGRLQQVEDYVIFVYTWATNVFFDLTKKDLENSESIEALHLYVAVLEKKHLVAVADSMNYEDLSQLVKILNSTLTNFVTHLEIVLNKNMEKDEREKSLEETPDIYIGLSKLVTDIITKLDNIRSEIFKS